MAVRNVELSEQEEALIQRLVATGRYRDAGAVIRQGMRLLEEQECDDEAKLEALKAAIQVGIDAIERGDYVTLRSDEEIESFFDSLTRKALREIP